MKFNPDDIMTREGRVALAAEAERAGEDGFTGAVAESTAVFLASSGNYRTVTSVLTATRLDGSDRTIFEHITLGDPTFSTWAGAINEMRHGVDGPAGGGADIVPISAYRSENALDVVEHIAAAHASRSVEFAAAIPTRVKAHVVEMANGAASGEELLKNAAEKFRDPMLEDAVKNPGKRHAIAISLLKIAAEQEFLRDRDTEDLGYSADKHWRGKDHIFREPAAVAMIRDHARTPAEYLASRTPEAESELVEARTLVSVLNWSPIMTLSPNSRVQELQKRDVANTALGNLALKDPLAAAMLYSEARPDGALSYPAHNEAIRFSNEKWREYAAAVSEVAIGARPKDDRFRAEVLSGFLSSPWVRGNVVDTLQIYAWSQKLPETEMARNEFVATVEVVKRLRGHEPQVVYPAEQKAFDLVKALAEERAFHNGHADSARNESKNGERAIQRVNQLDGRDLTKVPLRAAVREYVSGKGSLGRVFLKARTHFDALTRADELGMQRLYRTRDVEAGHSR